ncbi:MAG: hypothetical protein M5U22_12050 [Thermoleophilia bacterium]|nr:hypothetical protein [Thermoleophilia bacterium]
MDGLAALHDFPDHFHLLACLAAVNDPLFALEQVVGLYALLGGGWMLYQSPVVYVTCRPLGVP